WSGVTLAATGATAARVRIAPAGSGAVSLTLADRTGAPLAAVRTLALRPLTGPSAVAAARSLAGDLHELEWVPVHVAPAEVGASWV
ncbi:hypothetical protein RB625_35650, partial [Streptomyces californicus]